MFQITQVFFNPEEPIVGREIESYVEVRRPDGSIVIADTPESLTNGWHGMNYKWYRIQKENKSCSVHRGISATVQCEGCIKANVAEAKSYHCSPECLAEEWTRHLITHEMGKYNLQQNGSPAKPLAMRTEGGEIWFELCHSRNYTPTANDEDCVLGFECTVMDAVRRIAVSSTVVVSTSRVLSSPYPALRRMVPARASAGNAAGRESFTVLSYNLLSDVRASSEVHEHCPSWALSPSYRLQNLLREIKGYQADIVCLQEVQSNHFENFFGPELRKLGYQGELVIPAEAKTADGCATFFRLNRFKLQGRGPVYLNETYNTLLDDVLPLNQQMLARNRLIKDNFAPLFILETKFRSTGAPLSRRRLLCVVNARITVDDDLNDVKLCQILSLLNTLERIPKHANVSILICANLNSRPGSSAHSLLARGRVDRRHPDVVVDPLGILRIGDKLSHQIPLVSAYSCMKGSERNRHIDTTTMEPRFTHVRSNFVGTVDYIFYSADSLVVESLLELLPQDTALPSLLWSSDHIALLARFRFGVARTMP